MKPNWNEAPEGAEFYANHAFWRMVDGLTCAHSGGEWHKRRWSHKALKGFPDYCKRPGPITEIRVGDYINIERLTEVEFNRVVSAFERFGFKLDDEDFYSCIIQRLADGSLDDCLVAYVDGEIANWSASSDEAKRELTYRQVINAVPVDWDNHPDDAEVYANGSFWRDLDGDKPQRHDKAVGWVDSIPVIPLSNYDDYQKKPVDIDNLNIDKVVSLGGQISGEILADIVKGDKDSSPEVMSKTPGGPFEFQGPWNLNGGVSAGYVVGQLGTEIEIQNNATGSHYDGVMNADGSITLFNDPKNPKEKLTSPKEPLFSGDFKQFENDWRKNMSAINEIQGDDEAIDIEAKAREMAQGGQVKYEGPWKLGDNATRESFAFDKGSAEDQVKSPSHYQLMPGVESIEIIARSMTSEQWKGFCLGNMLKYRIRAGKKGDLQQDIDKANYYGELYDMHKGKCIKPE